MSKVFSNRDYLRINFISSLKHSENGNFAFCSTTSDSANATSPEIALVELNFTIFKQAFCFTNFSDPLAKSVVKFVKSRSIQLSF